jgi:hypothetical protein
MKPGSILTAALLGFVVASIAWLAFRPARQPAAVPPSRAGAASGAAVRAHRVVAYYFHGRVRCVSCNKIEAISRKGIEAGFADALKDGRLSFLPLNVDEPRNAHFKDDFRLVGQSLVLVEEKDGKTVRWKNMDKVWTLLDDERAFIPYVQQGVVDFLKKV